MAMTNKDLARECIRIVNTECKTTYKPEEKVDAVLRKNPGDGRQPYWEVKGPSIGVRGVRPARKLDTMWLDLAAEATSMEEAAAQG